MNEFEQETKTKEEDNLIEQMRFEKRGAIWRYAILCVLSMIFSVCYSFAGSIYIAIVYAGFTVSTAIFWYAATHGMMISTRKKSIIMLPAAISCLGSVVLSSNVSNVASLFLVLFIATFAIARSIDDYIDIKKTDFGKAAKMEKQIQTSKKVLYVFSIIMVVVFLIGTCNCGGSKGNGKNTCKNCGDSPVFAGGLCADCFNGYADWHNDYYD